jgi:hypothetical protein
MSALKKVTMDNIQSHVHTVLEFPETGVTRLYGDNSNGKSVMVKGIWDVVNGDITKPKLRRSIIRRGNEYGELTYERYDGLVLFVHIHLDAAQTYAELRAPGNDTVRRYLADKTIPLLVDKFGFHYNSDHSISVNVHKDDDPYLFSSTKHTINYDLMDSAMSDKFAEKSLEELQRILLEAKRYRKQFEQAKAVADATLGAIQLYDTAEEEEKRDRMAYLLSNLKHCVNFDTPLPKMYPLPKLNAVKVFPPVPDIYYPKIHKTTDDRVPDITAIYNELEMLRNNVCPTCGRDFKEM